MLKFFESLEPRVLRMRRMLKKRANRHRLFARLRELNQEIKRESRNGPRRKLPPRAHEGEDVLLAALRTRVYPILGMLYRRECVAEALGWSVKRAARFA